MSNFYNSIIKRIFDFIIGTISFPFVFVVVICLAPIIYFTDKGPVFYNAQRAGKGYKPFKMFKLRTMYVNAPDLRNPDGSTFNSDDDPRVTPIGRFLRKTSLDEFPQFLNVLIGDMSLIGPRPKLYDPNEYQKPEWMKSYEVRPGITGYAQAYYRNSITEDEKFHWDAYYAEHVSFLMDLKILFHTFWSVVAQKNINTEQSYDK